MAKIVSQQELKALQEGGPIVHAPTEQVRVGDSVEIMVEGATLAYGCFVLENGRLCVRVTKLRTR
jgi:flagellar motor switch/type III secretory pathway protein FliN